MAEADRHAPQNPVRTVVVGAASLAAAMGIGRFAFTPLLPAMQQHQGLTLADGAWLASANYAGYLVGALALAARAPVVATGLRGGLVAVAVATSAMAVADGLAAWLVLRFVAGVASAVVLICASSWGLQRLAAAGRGDLAGGLFAGVGLGIALAGLIATLLDRLRAAAPELTWLVLGIVAAAVAAAVGRALEAGADDPTQTVAVAGESAVGVAGAGHDAVHDAPEAGHAGPTAARLSGRGVPAAVCALVMAYGGFGFGYIVPATFLPAIARDLIGDPLLAGWIWPVFGLAAAASTVAVAGRLGHWSSGQVAVASLLVMAVGAVAPAVLPGPVAVAGSALCVGGSFMVMTMAGIQAARRLAPDRAPQLVAAMTAAFAVGQLIGPLTMARVDAGVDAAVAMVGPGLAAGGVLLACAAALAVALASEATARDAARTHRTPPPGEAG